ncbi:MAG TPA: nodulation protein NfeD [Dissulfurispiraceae bacterium]|nr:nodulation protein NfeD [Dissulfurispiraceae bacterium]
MNTGKRPAFRSVLFFLAAIFVVLVSLMHGIHASEKEAGVSAGRVLLITVKGIINPVASEYIGGAIRQASDMKAEALIIRLDTPGGLDSSMREIIKGIEASPVPVVVYVAPSGARAASAGVFITIAAHIAAMAPGTNIGAAHPVQIGGNMDKVMSEKVTNDAAAFIRTLALQRGRNAVWAEEAVRKSVSITETEALKLGVIDLIAKDLTTLLSELDGRKVTTAAGEHVLKTAGARVVEREMSLRNKILDLISNPDVAYILMLLGFYGLFFELTNPGAIFPGVMGGICLILGFYALQTLPVNYAGLLLIIMGLVLFVLEVKIISHGLLTIGGIIALVFGSLMLFESPLPFFNLSLAVIVPVVMITTLLFVFTAGLAYKAFRKKPLTGTEGLIGLEGTASTDISSEGGVVRIHGELWSGWSDAPIPKGSGVVVEAVQGLKLKVTRLIP